MKNNQLDPGNSHLHKVSVVITAYNRTTFLGEAVNSIMRNDRSEIDLELIIISNRDFHIDSIPEDVTFEKIIMEGTIGEYLKKGIEIAKGEIIAFLDDDDLWNPNKINRLTNVFSDSDIIFYHNLYLYIDQLGRPVKHIRKVEKDDLDSFETPLSFKASIQEEKIRESIERRADFNLSCIAVRRSFALKFTDLLQKISSAQDGFFFWAAVMSNEVLFIDHLKLTKYRVHDSNTSGAKITENKAKELQKEIKTFKILNQKVEEEVVDKNFQKIVRKWIDLYYYEYTLIYLILFEKRKLPIIEVSLLILRIGWKIHNPLKFRVMFLAFISVINKKLALFVYNYTH